MQTSVFITPNSLIVECIINPSGGTTKQSNPFDTQQQLEGRKIIGIETYSDQDVSYSPISTTNPILTPALFKGAFLRIYCASLLNATGQLEAPEGLRYDQIPLPAMRRVNNYDTTAGSVTSGGRDIFRIRPAFISWTKCAVQFPNPVSISQPYSALFLVHYLDEGDRGEKYMM